VHYAVRSTVESPPRGTPVHVEAFEIVPAWTAVFGASPRESFPGLFPEFEEAVLRRPEQARYSGSDRQAPAFERFMPSPRKPWMSKGSQMGIFDAAGLGLIFYQRMGYARSSSSSRPCLLFSEGN
jgi:hypothetical protein